MNRPLVPSVPTVPPAHPAVAHTPAALGFALLILLAPGVATAQIANNVKTSTDVTAHRQAIEQYVSSNAQKIGAVDDPEQQAAGREAIISGASLGGAAGAVAVAGAGAAAQNQPSPAYLDAYVQAVDKHLAPLAGHEDMRVRLNAAIAAARVAERANNARLSGLAVRFMNDKQPAVALWGVKAARAMLPSVLVAPGKNPLTAALAQTVQRHALASVTTEVYDALTLDMFNRGPNNRPAANAIKAVVPEMLRVYRMRVDGYALGLPSDPSVDNIAAEFLAFQPVWQQMTPAQQQEAVQTIALLLGFAGQHAELMSPEERQPLLPLFRRTGQALQVIGNNVNSQPVIAAAKAVQNISGGTDGSQVRKATDAVATALAQVAQFKDVKPAPVINVLPPEPEPAEAGAGEGGDAAPTGNAPAAPAGPGKAPPAPPVPIPGQNRPPAPPPGR